MSNEYYTKLYTIVFFDPSEELLKKKGNSIFSTIVKRQIREPNKSSSTDTV